jgi:predicted nuclease of restriction endonuclease-like (RecB) superfamily
MDNSDKREFYIAEAAKNNWSARQLERQVNSQLFERLLLKQRRGRCAGRGPSGKAPHGSP